LNHQVRVDMEQTPSPTLGPSSDDEPYPEIICWILITCKIGIYSNIGGWSIPYSESPPHSYS
jgi:hypothetical protein